LRGWVKGEDKKRWVLKDLGHGVERNLPVGFSHLKRRNPRKARKVAKRKKCRRQNGEVGGAPGVKKSMA